jgi:hypothetical protein
MGTLLAGVVLSGVLFSAMLVLQFVEVTALPFQGSFAHPTKNSKQAE